MHSNFSYISNSTVMLILCSLAVITVLCQSLYFLRVGFKRGNELGIEKKSMKQVVVSSGLFSIVPSLPILISYMILVPALGKFLPWLRLSVIGSAAYETMAADMAVKANGYASLSEAFSPEAYIAIVWTVTGAILLSSLSTFLLKPYDKKMKSMQGKGSKFMPILISAMFLGLLGSMAAPYLVDFNNVTGILTMIVAGVTVVIFNKVGKKVKVVKEFAFAGSMITGMVFAATYSNFVG